jgi:O-antigen/teichoic acid export membrane protein
MWAGTGRVLAAFLGLLVHSLLARMLEPEAYGVFIVALGLIILLSTLATFGLDQASVRLVAKTVAENRGNDLGALTRRILGLTAAGVLVVCGLFLAQRQNVLGSLLNSPGLVVESWTLAVWAAAGAMLIVISEIFRGLQNIRMAAIFGGPRNTGILLGILFVAGLAVARLQGIASLSPILWIAAGSTLLD